MAKKPNILSRALSKLRLMEKQLVAESEVLGELKAKEEADEHEFEALRTELNDKNAAISRLNAELQRAAREKGTLEADLLRSLNEKDADLRLMSEAARVSAEKRDAEAASQKEELGKLQKQNAELSRAIAEKGSEFCETLGKERADFRLNCEKLEKTAAETGKELLRELDVLKTELRQKSAELVRAGADNQLALDRLEAAKADYGGHLLKQQGQHAALDEELKRRKAEGEDLLRETGNRVAELVAALAAAQADSKAAQDKARAEAKELAEANKRLRSEKEALSAEVEKLRGEAEAARAENAAAAVKLKEQDIFAKSAASALKEKEEDLGLMGEKVKDLSDELAKNTESYHRRIEIQRMELEERKSFVAHLNRELEKTRTEAESFRSKLAELEKAGKQPGAGRDKPV